MTLVEFVPPKPHPLWKLCLQMGITDVIIKVNPTLTGLPDPWRHETLARIVGGLKIAGLKVVGLEGDPFDMAPIKEFKEKGGKREVDAAKARREDALAHYRELLESMGRLGIRLLCYNFMAGQGWSRTGVREGRGGAKATYFSLEECLGRKEHEDHKGLVPSASFAAKNNPVQERLLISHEQVWANYEHFIKSVMPTAERCGVRMALHPDDPCLPSLGGYARIFGSVEAYDRAYALHPSPSNAVTFCQANFKLMLGRRERGTGNGEQGMGNAPQLSTSNSQLSTLEDVARHFRDRIAFIHVRDVEGTVEDFTELFHDQGTTDQFALMRTYRELGLDVPVRGDHVPEMEGDRLLAADCIPGYFTLGRLFANGYLKALLEGTEAKSVN